MTSAWNTTGQYYLSTQQEAKQVYLSLLERAASKQLNQQERSVHKVSINTLSKQYLKNKAGELQDQLDKKIVAIVRELDPMCSESMRQL